MQRSILGLIYFIQGLRRCGVDVDSRLAAIGIQAKTLDPTGLINDHLLREIQNHIGYQVKPEYGFFVGQHYVLAGYGPFLMLLVTAQSIRQGLDIGIRYLKLTYLLGSLHLIQQDRCISLIYQPDHKDTQTDQLRIQCEIAGTYKFCFDLAKMIGVELPQIQVKLPFKAPDSIELLQQYQAYYGKMVQFNAEQASFSLSDSLLNTVLPTADPVAHQMYAVKCQEEIKRLSLENSEPTQNIIQYVKNYLELQQGVMPTMTETALALSISERTLRYQLQQLNTSYKAIREQLLKDRALRLMQDKEYSIERISDILGYSEPAAFNHAFKRWFGQSPKQYGK